MTALMTSEPPAVYTKKRGNRNKDMKMVESQTIKGKHIAITGIFVFYKRKDAFDLIRDHGGIPQENVTKETDYLVVGYYRKDTVKSGKSNKRIIAERYMNQGQKIKIIKEDEFLQMLWFSPPNIICNRVLHTVI